MAVVGKDLQEAMELSGPNSGDSVPYCALSACLLEVSRPLQNIANPANIMQGD